MSKPSELLDDILDHVIALRRIGVAWLDGELYDRVKVELTDAARLIGEATAAANEGIEDAKANRAALDRNGHP